MARPPHPIVFLVLYLPFSMTGGYLSVTLGFLLSHHGVSTAAIAGIGALALLPHTWKVFWAPIVDTTLTSKIWYALGVVVAAVALLSLSLQPLTAASVAQRGLLAFAMGLATTFVGMACESLMAHASTPEMQGRVGGWSQAGNVGGQGLGGALGLALATHVGPVWISGVGLSTAMVLCCAALLFVPEGSHDHRHPNLGISLWRVVKDVWAVGRSRAGLIAILIFIAPIGTAAAGNLFASVAQDWKAGADVVALVSGFGGAVAALGGSIIGGYLCDRLDRKVAYVLFGLVMAVIAAGMALAPRTPLMFSIFALAYSASAGLVWAAFAALTLETIGKGAAATKYNLFASLSNVPILYVVLVDGWARTRWDAGAMLLAEAGMTVVAAMAIGGLLLATKKRPAAAA